MDRYLRIIPSKHLHYLVDFVVIKVTVENATTADFLVLHQIPFVGKLLWTLEGTLEELSLLMCHEILFGLKLSIASGAVKEPFAGISLIVENLGQAGVTVAVHV